MGIELDLTETSADKMDRDVPHFRNLTELDAGYPEALKAMTLAPNTGSTLLPALEIETGKQNLNSSETESGISKFLGEAERGIIETVKTLAHIPGKDVLEVGKALEQVVVKDGTSLVFDGIVVAKSKGTNLVADAKMAVDLLQTGTSKEGKDLYHSILKAWHDGEENKKVS